MSRFLTSRFRPEPAHLQGTTPRVGVLLVNLGTPTAPTPVALRAYLAEFLWDERVVEIPRFLWGPILFGVVLNVRPKKSAEKYAQIWMSEGSPLAVHTERQAKLLRGLLGPDFGHILVDWAMRYGKPSVAEKLDLLKAQGCNRILVVPLYPQYSSSTTASAIDAVAAWLLCARSLPELRYVRSFYDDPTYIAALAASVNDCWMRTAGRPDKLVISFHGLPRMSRDLHDPYFSECLVTGRLLAKALGLTEDRYIISFQSRFGNAEWLKPYTQSTLEEMARNGVGRVDVICPGFVSDCLETLEEIAMECKTAFLTAGGKEFNYIPCLNERDDWIAMLAGLVRKHLGHWQIAPAQQGAASEANASAPSEPQ
jgi:ferrochelatase